MQGMMEFRALDRGLMVVPGVSREEEDARDTIHFAPIVSMGRRRKELCCACYLGAID